MLGKSLADFDYRIRRQIADGCQIPFAFGHQFANGFDTTAFQAAQRRRGEIECVLDRLIEKHFMISMFNKHSPEFPEASVHLAIDVGSMSRVLFRRGLPYLI